MSCMEKAENRPSTPDAPAQTPNQTAVTWKSILVEVFPEHFNGTQREEESAFPECLRVNPFTSILTYFVLRTNLQVYFFIFPISLLRKLRSEILLKLIQLWWNWDWSTILSSFYSYTQPGIYVQIYECRWLLVEQPSWVFQHYFFIRQSFHCCPSWHAFKKVKSPLLP